jgi:hypothetical protein
LSKGEKRAASWLSDHSRICVAQKVLPEHARTGDYLVLDPIENRFRVDQTITELHRQAARRLAEYFFD